MSRKGHRGTERTKFKETKRYERGGLEYATDRAFEKYKKLRDKAIDNGKQLIEEYSRQDIKNMIKSEYNAGATWQEAVKTTTDVAFRDSFNVYSKKETGEYDIQVLSEKQASNWLNKLRLHGEKVGGATVEDIMTGKFDIKVYWGSLTAGLDAGEVALMAQYFFGS